MRLPVALRRCAFLVAVAPVLAALPVTAAVAADEPITNVSPTGYLNDGTHTVQFDVGATYLQAPRPTVTFKRTADPTETVTPDNVQDVTFTGSHFTVDVDLTRKNPGAWSISVSGTVTPAMPGDPTTVISSCSACFTVLALAPTVTHAVTSVRVSQSGSITLNGTNFTADPYCTSSCTGEPTVTVSGTGVTLSGSTTATATSITKTVTVAALTTPGFRDVTITNTDGQSAVCTGCLLLAPHLASVAYTDNASATAYGQGAFNRRLTLTGDGYEAGVTVGFAASTGITINATNRVDAQHITVDVTLNQIGSNPPSVTGSPANNHLITVQNPDGGTHASAQNFNIATGPTVTSVTPMSRGRGAQDQQLTIVGTGFATTGVTVSIPDVAIQSYDSINASGTEIKVTVDISDGLNIAGNRAVTVVNNDNKGQYVKQNGFAIDNLQVDTVSPTDVVGDGTKTLTITGSGFANDAAPTLIKSGAGAGVVADVIGTGVSVNVDGTSLTASFALNGAAPGSWAVRITNSANNPGTGTCSCSLNVVAPAPTLSGVSPASRGAGSVNETIEVNGTGFRPGATVTFDNPGIHVLDTTVTSVKVTVHVNIDAGANPATPPVPADMVYVTNTDGQQVSTAFAVAAAPSPESVSPTSRGQGTSTTVTVSGVLPGDNFATSGATLIFSGTGVTAGATTYTAANPPTHATLSATVTVAADAAPGARSITVKNPDGGRGLCACTLTVNLAPTVTSVAPAKIARTVATPVTITGTNFAAGATVLTGSPNITAGTATVNNSTTITVTLTAAAGAALTDYTLSVKNSDEGTGSLATPYKVFTVPDAPTGVSAVRGNAKATVSWVAPASDGNDSLIDYTVTSSPGGLTATVAAGTLSTDVTGLTNGTAYTFTVVARNAAGNSVASSPSTAVTPATVPGAPTGVGGTSGNAKVTVSWIAPASNGGSAITGYTVTASPGGATASVDGSTLSTDVTGLTNGTAYTFTVLATNDVGNSVASSPSASVTPATVPNAPTGVSADADDASAFVTWSAPSFNGGSTITGYTVTATPGGATVPVGGSTLEANVTGLTNGTAYTFTVVATNAKGNSVASAPSAPVTPFTRPNVPTNVAATPGDHSAHVTWSAPSSTGGSPITGYTVTASPGGATRTVSGTTFAADFTGLTNGQSYTFSVKATNAAGDSDPSAPSGSVTPAGVPGAPGSVHATKGHGSASVTWTAPSDNGSPIVNYTVTSTPGGITKTVTGTAAAMTGLTNGTSYTFTVKANNGAGAGPGATSNAVIPTWATGLTIAATGKVTAGGVATVTGKLYRTQFGTGIAGKSVRIYGKIAPSTTYGLLATVTTDSNGVYKRTFTLARNTVFQARFLAVTGYDGVNSALKTTQVAYRVSASYSLSGRTLTVTGGVYPGAAGRTIYLWLRRSDGTYTSLAATAISGSSTYRLVRSFSRGTYYVLVHINSSSTNVATSTALRKIVIP